MESRRLMMAAACLASLLLGMSLSSNRTSERLGAFIFAILIGHLAMEIPSVEISRFQLEIWQFRWKTRKEHHLYKKLLSDDQWFASNKGKHVAIKGDHVDTDENLGELMERMLQNKYQEPIFLKRVEKKEFART